ncbi:MAG TPA: hypothetical protein VK536_09855, partial [Candidatus Limnocylindrales bacterium]|nr:hypothetical protein [Candidatus Limnocylindrales bacterium]
TADVWVVKTDSSGNQEWNETFGTANYSEATSVIQTNDEGYAVAGYTNSFGAGNYDFLLVKLASSSSTPTPSPSPTPSPLPTPTLTVNCVSSTSYNSFNVQINGNLAFNGTGISGVPILLSYSADNGASWQSLTTVNTDTNGGFLAQWLGPSASGDYLLNATYSGSATYSSVSTVVNLAVMPFISRNANLAFSVESNATVSALAFNSTSNELSFIVSGPSGSTGYANVYISRTLVSDASAITAYKDGNSISYTLTSTADAWVLQFNFGLSTHQITIYLASKSTVSAISLNFGNWLWVIVVVAVIVVLVAAITAWFKRNKIRVVWNKTEEPHAETESVLFAPKQRRKCGEST